MADATRAEAWTGPYCAQRELIAWPAPWQYVCCHFVPIEVQIAAEHGGRCRRIAFMRGYRTCRRGLRFCGCDDPDCRRSLALAMACAEGRC